MYSFQLKTKILFGEGRLNTLCNELKALHSSKVLIVTDRGIVQAGILDKLQEILKKGPLEFEVFEEVEANPKDKTLINGAKAYNEFGADAVIGLGGGSPIDAAKSIAVIAANDDPIEELCAGFDGWKNKPKPIVAVPTTAGTGSEVSAVALISFPEKNTKRALRGRSMQPDLAVCDPLLTLGLPPSLTATTGIDALSHAVEGYVCMRMPNPFTDMFAEKAVRLVQNNLRQAYSNGNNVEARSNMLLASTLGLMAAGNAGGLGIVHAVTHAMGGFYDVPHGLVISAVLPTILEYNAIAVPEKYATLAALMGESVEGLPKHKAAKKVSSAVRELLQDLNLHDTLSTLGLQEKDIPHLAELSMKDGSTGVNPRRIDIEGFKRLYTKMLKE